MPGKKARKNAQPSPPRDRAGFHPHLPCTGVTGRKMASAGVSHEEKVLFMAEAEDECAFQLRRIGDKLNFRQKLVNLICKLFHLGT